MIVGAFPLSEHLRRVYLAGGRIAETTKICLTKFRKARPADHAPGEWVQHNCRSAFLANLPCPTRAKGSGKSDLSDLCASPRALVSRSRILARLAKAKRKTKAMANVELSRILSDSVLERCLGYREPRALCAWR